MFLPFWALDITPKSQATEAAMKMYKEANFKFVETRSKAHVNNAAILGQARAMIDWNSRNTFCPACGRRTVSADAGYKRACPPDQVPSDPEEAKKEQQGQRPPCISANGVHNFSYTRTDPVVIACVVHPHEDKILLGRQKSWPAGVYSCLAGFVEAGESIEEAVRREVREESGVVVSSVVYHSSQPWPFPNSLMIGCIAEAVTDKVKLEDKELDDAGWFSRTEVVEALSGSRTISFDSPGVGGLRIPPETAIAHQLIKTWAVEKEWGGEGQLNAKI
jgi:NAD+ diphosphatase